MRTHRLLSLAPAVLCAIAVQLVSAPATSAHGAWLPPQTLGPVDYFGADNQDGADSQHILAGNARGDDAVVWESPRGLLLARASPGRPFGPAQLLTREREAEASVAIDDRGDVLVVWQYSDNSVVVPDVGVDGTEAICCERIKVAMLRAGPSRASSVSLTPGSLSARVESIAISGDGSLASVVYRSTPRSLIKRARLAYPPGSELVVRLAAFDKGFGPAVDLGRKGILLSLRATAHQVIALHTDPDGDADTVHEAIIDAATARLRSREVGDAGALRFFSSIGGFDRDGDLALLVEENLNLGFSHDLITQPVGKQLRVLPIAVERGHESEHGLILEPSSIFDEPALSVSPGGSFLGAWTVYSSGGDSLRVATGRLPSARLSSPTTVPLLSPTSPYGSPQVATDSSGQAVVMVVRKEVGTNGVDAQVVGLFRTSSGRFTAPTVLDEVGNENSLGDAVVTINEHGEGTALWEADPNYKSELVARRFRVP